MAKNMTQCEATGAKFDSMKTKIIELVACLEDVLGANGDVNVMDFARYRAALAGSQDCLQKYTPLFVAKCIRYEKEYESTLEAMKDFGLKRIYFVNEMDERPELVTNLDELMNSATPDRFFSIPNEDEMMPLVFTSRFSDEEKTKAFEKFFVRASYEASAAELFDGIAYASIEEPGYFATGAVRTLLTEFEVCEVTNLSLDEAVQKMLDAAITDQANNKEK
jgi:hypothetical protein